MVKMPLGTCIFSQWKYLLSERVEFFPPLTWHIYGWCCNFKPYLRSWVQNQSCDNYLIFVVVVERGKIVDMTLGVFVLQQTTPRAAKQLLNCAVTGGGALQWLLHLRASKMIRTRVLSLDWNHPSHRMDTEVLQAETMKLSHHYCAAEKLFSHCS